MTLGKTLKKDQATIKASFQQKSAGVSLFIIGVLAIYFFAKAWPMHSAGQASPAIPDGFVSLVLVTLGLVIVAAIVLQVVLVIGQGSAPEPTAQEQLASLKAGQISHGVLFAGVLAVVGLYIFGFSAFFMANAAMLALFLAEITRFALQLFYARKTT